MLYPIESPEFPLGARREKKLLICLWTALWKTVTALWKTLRVEILDSSSLPFQLDNLGGILAAQRRRNSPANHFRRRPQRIIRQMGIRA